MTDRDDDCRVVRGASGRLRRDDGATGRLRTDGANGHLLTDGGTSDAGETATDEGGEAEDDETADGATDGGVDDDEESEDADEGGETVPEVTLTLYQLSVNVTGQATDDLEDAEDSATRLMDYLVEKAGDLEDHPDDRGLG